MSTCNQSASGRLLRFADLKSRNIVKNWPTLLRWIQREGFPPGMKLGPNIDGAVFDYGGHSFHSPHPEVRDIVFDALEMHEQRRNAQCFFRNEFIPYPNSSSALNFAMWDFAPTQQNRSAAARADFQYEA
jgi:hypothetical protein